MRSHIKTIIQPSVVFYLAMRSNITMISHAAIVTQLVQQWNVNS